MQNQEIIQIIENLKGRKNYEEKKASKLGFTSLYAYFEDKILKEKKANEESKKELEEIKADSKLKNKKKKVVVVADYLILYLILLIRKIAIVLKTAKTCIACPEFPKRN